MTIDLPTLKKLAELQFRGEGSEEEFMAYVQAIRPAAVLELIAEVERSREKLKTDWEKWNRLADTDIQLEQEFEIIKLRTQVAGLEARLATAKSALEFYANDDWDIGCGCCSSGSSMELRGDSGRRAKQALEEMK